MSRRWLGGWAAATGGVLILLVTVFGTAQDKQPAGDGPFGLTKVWNLHLEIPAKEYEAMQPAGGKGLGPGQPPKDKKAEGGRPGEKNLVGIYTVVENIDGRFLKDRFQSDQGLLMKPARMRGPDYLGDDWDKYKGQYQPQGEVTKEQARRVIDFAKLVNQGSDEQFKKE